MLNYQRVNLIVFHGFPHPSALFFQRIPRLRQPFQVPQVRGRVAAARQPRDVLEAQLMVPRRQADVVRVVTFRGAG